MNLYQTSQDIRVLEKILQETESENLIKELDKLEQGFEQKLKNIWKLIRVYETYEIWIDDEIKRLQELKKHYKTQTWNLKNYVAYAMETTGKDKVETDLFKFSFRKSTAVEIFEEDKIPEDFKKQKVEIKIDKIELKKALQAGQEIEGAQLVERKNLQIK